MPAGPILFMTKKPWFLILLAVVLAGVYVFYFTDRFKPKTMLIFHTSRNTRPEVRPRRDVAAANPETQPVTFGFGEHRYRLTEIEVVPLAVWQSNQNVLPVWHLISSSNSIPLNNFTYGQHIPGMKPSVAGGHAEPLEPNLTYRLFVTAGSVKGQHDFEAKPAN